MLKLTMITAGRRPSPIQIENCVQIYSSSKKTSGLCAFSAPTRRPQRLQCSVQAAATEQETEPSADVPVSVEESEEAEISPPSFKDLGVDERVTVTLPSIGVHDPSDIQLRAIPAILEGETLALQAYTGSGKTLAFLLPVVTMAIARLESRVSKKDDHDLGLEAIIVAPSRELAMQTMRVAQKLLPQEAWPLVQQCIGGANGKRQLEALRKNKPLVVVGTPGRLAEHSRSGALRSHKAGIVVMDEVDQLLCPQFREDMLRLVQQTGARLPNGPQIVMASATMTPRLVKDIQSFLGTKDAIPIITPHAVPIGDVGGSRSSSGAGASSSGGGGTPAWGWGQESGFWAGKAGAASNRSSAGGIEHGTLADSMPPQLVHTYVTEVKRHHVDTVRRVVYALKAERVICFMNYHDRLRDVMYKLAKKGLDVGVLHGELPKQQRQAVLDGFRGGKFRVLLVSDVAARGLDVIDCDVVINLEMPSNAAHYAHRAGRTGRMGRAGVVVNIVEKQAQFVVEKLSRSLVTPIPAGKISAGMLTVIADGKVQVLKCEVEEGVKPVDEDETVEAVDDVPVADVQGSSASMSTIVLKLD